MGHPLPVRKQAVDLATGPRKVGSRIRRAPPPPAEKKLTKAELREREAWVIATGILAVALAVTIILLAATRWAGWSPAHYQVTLRDKA